MAIRQMKANMSGMAEKWDLQYVKPRLCAHQQPHAPVTNDTGNNMSGAGSEPAM